MPFRVNNGAEDPLVSIWQGGELIVDKVFKARLGRLDDSETFQPWRYLGHGYMHIVSLTINIEHIS